jgi:flagellar hook assembly protein FlgD
LIAVDESRALTIIVEMVGPCRTVPETIGATVDGSFSESGCVEQSGTQSTANRTLRCATLPTSVAWTWNDDVLEAKPNPFTKSTRVTYAVIASSTMHVEIGVYDSAGRRVRALVSGRVPPGRHDTVWDGTDDDGDAAPAGVYFCRAVVGTRSSVVRVIRIQ